MNTPLEEVEWLDHHITEEIFQTEDERSKSLSKILDS